MKNREQEEPKPLNYQEASEPCCPECGSPDIRSLGYNYDQAKVFYECVDCEAQGEAEYFEP